MKFRKGKESESENPDLRSLRNALEVAQHGKQKAEQYAAEWKRLAESEPTKVEMFAMHDALDAARAECADAKLRLQHLREELEHTVWRGFSSQPLPPLPQVLGKAEEKLLHWQERALKAERERDALKIVSRQRGLTAEDALVLWDSARDQPSRKEDNANIHEVRLRGSKPRREASLHVRGPLDPED